MKQVLNRKRKFTYRDISRYFMIAIAHYVMVMVFTIIVFAIKFWLFGEIIGVVDPLQQTMIWYSIIIAPGINTLMHIIISERGMPWLRGGMWIHTLLIFIFITVGGIL